MAFGVMNVADSLGISVPDDLSVVGFDGTKFATFIIPSLSTIRRPTTEMASLAYVNGIKDGGGGAPEED